MLSNLPLPESYVKVIENIEQKKKLKNHLGLEECRVTVWPVMDENSSMIFKMPLDGGVCIPKEYRLALFSYHAPSGIHHARCHMPDVKEALLLQPSYEYIVECDNTPFDMALFFTRSPSGPVLRTISLGPRMYEDTQFYAPELVDHGSEADLYMEDLEYYSEDADSMG